MNYTIAPPNITNVYGIHPGDIESSEFNNSKFSMIPHFFYEFNEISPAIVIYAGPLQVNNVNLRTVNKDLVVNYILQNLKPNTKILFDNIFEGHVATQVNAIHQIIERVDIPASDVYYFCGAWNAVEKYHEYCEKYNIKNQITLYNCNSWEYLTKVRFLEHKLSSQYNIKIKEKNYLCFNRMSRNHRVALLSLLSDEGLLNHGYYSFFPDNYFVKNTEEYEIRDLVNHGVSNSTIDRILCNYRELLPQLPLILNIKSDENKNYLSENDKYYFDNSYYSLVTETYFFEKKNMRGLLDHEAIFFSEKTYKPILMNHPFILLHKSNALAALRQCGFRTFAPYINEDYDLQQNHEQRLLMIVDEVKRLSCFTEDQWLEWQQQIAPIVEHNSEVILNRKKHDYAIR